MFHLRKGFFMIASPSTFSKTIHGYIEADDHSIFVPLPEGRDVIAICAAIRTEAAGLVA
jgi:hypothetical protein